MHFFQSEIFLLTKHFFWISHTHNVWSRSSENRYTIVIAWGHSFRIAWFESAIFEWSHGIYPSFTCAVDKTSIDPASHTIDLSFNNKKSFWNLVVVSLLYPNKWSNSNLNKCVTKHGTHRKPKWNCFFPWTNPSTRQGARLSFRLIQFEMVKPKKTEIKIK